MAANVTGLTSTSTVLGTDVAVKVDMGNVYLNDAEVINTDIETSNGVIHVTATVILPPADVGTIVDTAVAHGRFATLVAALTHILPQMLAVALLNATVDQPGW